MLATRPRAGGFTLIELIVVVAIVAILVTIAVPSFQTFLLNNRMAAQANDLISSLNFARSEAVTRAANVRVCAGTSCPSASASATSWATGWLVADSAGTPIRVQQALGGASTLTAGTNSITYSSAGRLSFPTAAVTLTLCPPSPASVQGRAIQIELTGRARVSSVACP